MTDLNSVVTSNVFSFLRALAGDEGQASSAGQAQPTYQDFVQQLRQPAANDIVLLIKAFVFKVLKQDVVEPVVPEWSLEVVDVFLFDHCCCSTRRVSQFCVCENKPNLAFRDKYVRITT